MRRSSNRLDERQRELIQSTMAVAYPFIAAPVIIAGLLYQAGSIQTGIFEFFLFATFYLVGFLPTTIVAWLEPNSPADEVRAASPT